MSAFTEASDRVAEAVDKVVADKSVDESTKLLLVAIQTVTVAVLGIAGQLQRIEEKLSAFEKHMTTGQWETK